jgi:hypothetical protein
MGNGEWGMDHGLRGKGRRDIRYSIFEDGERRGYEVFDTRSRRHKGLKTGGRKKDDGEAGMGERRTEGGGNSTEGKRLVYK